MITIQLSDGARGKPLRREYPDFASFVDDLREPAVLELATIAPSILEGLQPDVAQEKVMYETKLGAPVILPAVLKNQEGAKTEDNIEDVTLLALDYDDVTEEVLVDLLSNELKGYRWAAHTTFSHGASLRAGVGVRYRIWIELSAPVPADQWTFFRAKLDAMLPPIKSHDGKLQPDRQTRNPNRLNFAPSCTHEDAATFEYCDWRDFEGAEGATPLEVSLVINTSLADIDTNTLTLAPKSEEKYQPLDRDFVLKVQRNASRRKNDMEQLRAERLRKVLKGDAFVTSDSHDPTLDLARWLADELPLFSAEDIAKMVAPSLTIMRVAHGSDETEPGFIEKVQSWRVKQAKRKASLDAMQLPGMFPTQNGETSITTGHTPAVDGAEVDDSKPWIVQYSNTYWFKLRDGTGYSRQYIRAEAENCYLTFLAGTPKSPYYFNDDGERKTLKFTDVVRGCELADGAIFRVGNHSTYDMVNKEMQMACCVRDLSIQPKEHPEVDAWLRGFFNEHQEAALDWLAIYPRQELNSRALLLVGERHAGKTLLIKALSRIYGVDSGLNIDDKDEWNDFMLDCPLVFADEHTSVKLSALRAMVGGLNPVIKRKFLTNSRLEMKLRVLFAANDLEVLRVQEGVTSDSLAATAERFIAIRIKRREDLMPPTREEREQWAMSTIGEHVLWLSENRQIGGDAHSRFAGRPGGFDVTASIAIHSDRSATLCGIALDYLQERSDRKGGAAMSKGAEAFVREGILHITNKFLSERWKKVTDEAPRHRDLRSAMHGVSLDAESVVRRPTGTRRRYWRLDPEKLVRFAEDVGDYDGEVVREWLAKDDSLNEDNKPTTGKVLSLPQAKEAHA